MLLEWIKNKGREAVPERLLTADEEVLIKLQLFTLVWGSESEKMTAIRSLDNMADCAAAGIFNAGGVGPLTSILREGEAKEKEYALKIIVEIVSKVPESRLQMLQANVLEPLINALQSGQKGQVKDAAHIIDIMCQNSRAIQEALIEVGMIGHLLGLMLASDESWSGRVGAALGNFPDALTALIAIVKDSKPCHNRKNGAVIALCKLAGQSEATKQQIVQSGAVPHLVNSVKYTSTFSEGAAYFDGVVAPLIGLLQNNDMSIRSRAVSVLERLPQSIPSLISLLSTGSKEAKQSSFEALEKLIYKKTANQAIFLEADGVNKLLLMVGASAVEGDLFKILLCLPDTLSRMVKALQQNGNKTNYRAAIRQAKDMSHITASLIRLWREGDAYAQGFALDVLLQTKYELLQPLANELMPILVASLARADKASLNCAASIIEKLASDPIQQAALVQAGILAPLIELITLDDGSCYGEMVTVFIALVKNSPANQLAATQVGAKAPLLTIIQRTVDREDQLVHQDGKAALALGYLPDALDDLIGLLKVDQAIVRYYAVIALAQLVKDNPANQAHIVEEIDISELVKICLNDDYLGAYGACNVYEGAGLLAALVLGNPVARLAIIAADAMTLLKDYLISANSWSFVDSSFNIFNLFFHLPRAKEVLTEVCKKRLTNQRLFDALEKFPKDIIMEASLLDEEDAQADAPMLSIMTVAGGPQQSIGQLILKEMRRVQKIVTQLSSQIKEEKLSALMFLLLNTGPLTGQAIVQSGGIDPLIRLLQSSDKNIKEGAAEVIGVLARSCLSPRNDIATLMAGAIEQLIGLFVIRDGDTKAGFINILSDLAFRSSENTATIVTHAWLIDLFVARCRHKDLSVRQAAVVMLMTLAQTPASAQVLIDKGVIEILLELRGDPTNEDKYYCYKDYVEITLALLACSEIVDPRLQGIQLDESLIVNTLSSSVSHPRDMKARDCVFYLMNYFMEKGRYLQWYTNPEIRSTVLIMMDALEQEQAELPHDALDARNTFVYKAAQKLLRQMNNPPMPQSILLKHIIIDKEDTFTISDRDRLGGSALICGVFDNITDGSLWVAKCNALRTELDSKNEASLELVANEVYKYFGVPVPNVAIARLPIKLPAWAENIADLGIEPTRTHTFYLLSKIVPNFHLFGAIPEFTDPDRLILTNPDLGELECLLFGHVAAVACFLNDVDFIGGSGGNIGYQVQNGKAVCVNIDPGHAFNNHPDLRVDARQMRVATMAANSVLSFDDMPTSVKAEFLQTLALIVQLDDDTIKRFFQRVGVECLADKVQSLTALLIERRDMLREAFAQELVGVVGRRPNYTFVDAGINEQDINSNMATMRGRAADNLHYAPYEALIQQHAIPFVELSYNPLHDRVGRGTYADVFRATCRGEVVAFKQLKDQAIPENAQVELKQEAAMMLRLNHPNIVKLLKVCLISGHLGLVMEFAPLGSLYQVLRNGEEHNWLWRLKVCLRAARGVCYLHSLRILHRDLKTKNILVFDGIDGPQPKITDFGLTLVKSSTRNTIDQGFDVAGTAAYMAPELMGVNATYRTASDIYSLGCVLKAVTTEEEPWQGETLVRITMLVLQSMRPPLVAVGLPEGMTELINRSWRQSVDERPRAEVIVQDLQQIHDNYVEAQRAAPAQAN